MTNLRLPKVNKEIKLSQANKGILRKVQSCVEKSISAVLHILRKLKNAMKAKSKLDAQKVYAGVSDATKLLVTVH